MAQPGNQAVDLDTGELAALTGLGTLGNLDFQFFAGIQVFGGNAKPA